MNQHNESRNNHKEISLNSDTVRKIAELIHLDMDAAQADSFSKQFTQIINYFQLLERIDTSEILPANEGSNQATVTREDQVTPSLDRSEFLAGVPDIKDEFVRIPPIFDGRET